MTQLAVPSGDGAEDEAGGSARPSLWHRLLGHLLIGVLLATVPVLVAVVWVGVVGVSGLSATRLYRALVLVVLVREVLDAFLPWWLMRRRGVADPIGAAFVAIAVLTPLVAASTLLVTLPGRYAPVAVGLTCLYYAIVVIWVDRPWDTALHSRAHLNEVYQKVIAGNDEDPQEEEPAVPGDDPRALRRGDP